MQTLLPRASESASAFWQDPQVILFKVTGEVLLLQ